MNIVPLKLLNDLSGGRGRGSVVVRQPRPIARPRVVVRPPFARMPKKSNIGVFVAVAVVVIVIIVAAVIFVLKQKEATQQQA